MVLRFKEHARHRKQCRGCGMTLFVFRRNRRDGPGAPCRVPRRFLFLKNRPFRSGPDVVRSISC
jgi:hypothetical protein